MAISPSTIQRLRYSDLSNWDNSWRTDSGFKVFRDACPFCQTRLRRRFDEFGRDDYFREEFAWESWACLACGWWWEGTLPERSYSRGTTKAAILKSSTAPDSLIEGIDEIRKNSTTLFQMNPTKFERFVGDILSEFYQCEVVHCGKSHDGGIDLIVLDSDQGYKAVQVKRRMSPQSVESVSLVREFRGALLLAGQDRGLIVTTAHHFSKAAVEASTPAPQHLVPQTIDLIDCRKLLDIMKTVVSPDEASFAQLCKLNLLTGLTPERDVVRKIEASLAQFAKEVRAVERERKKAFKAPKRWWNLFK